MSMISPICFLFVGLAGILYLFHYDKLVSLYIIPYLLLFVVGTIWLKAIKRHIQKTMMAVEGAFHVCLAKPIEDRDGYIYVVFVNDAHRHDRHYASKLVQSIESTQDKLMNEYHALARKKSVLIKDDDIGSHFYVRAYLMKDIDKLNATWEQDDYFPVLFIDEKDTFVIKKKDLSFYGKQ